MVPINLRTLGSAVLCTIPLWMHAAFADVTLRYQPTLKFGPAAPQQIKDQFEKSMAGFGQASLRMKNGKELSSSGAWSFLINCTTQQMVMIDNEKQTLAKLAVADFAEQMSAAMPKPPEMSEEAKKSMPVMKTSIQTNHTGKTESILGIQAEEREIVITMEMSPRPNSGVQMPPMNLKIVIEAWAAKPDEALHNQAIRELMGFKLWTNAFMSPGQMAARIVANMPGEHGELAKAVAEMSSGGVLLRTRVIAQLNENELFEMTQEAVEVSSAAVDEALFQVPAAYREVTPGEVIRSMLEKSMAAARPNPKP